MTLKEKYNVKSNNRHHLKVDLSEYYRHNA